MDFNQLYNKYNFKRDIKYTDFDKFRKKLHDDITFNELDVILADLYHVDLATFRKISPVQLDLLVAKIKEITSTKSSLTSRFKLNGKEYGLIPNFLEISAGELIDLDNLLSVEDIPSLMSILYRPIVKKQFNPFNILGQTRYSIEDYHTIRTEEFQNINLDIVDGCLDFFLDSWQILK